MRFQDPVVNYASLDGFIFNVQALRTAFKAQFNLHDIDINGPEEIKTRLALLAQMMICILYVWLCWLTAQILVDRWTMTLKSRFLPWQPELVFSGYSYYTIETVYGKIAGQRDVWDAIQDNSSPSVSHRSLCMHGQPNSDRCSLCTKQFWPWRPACPRTVHC